MGNIAMSNVLITGGAGFIGANLCERLLRNGDTVTCLDNFSTSNRENVAHLLGDPNFTLMIGDVRSTIRVDADTIYNLACPASPPKYQIDPVYTTETCVLGAINVLELARRTGARVFHASTSEVYGEPQCSPQPETYRGNVNPWGPRACYDEGKRCAEALFYDYSTKYGVDVRVARIFNTYGPRMHPDDGRVVSNFIVQALGGRPLTIYGDGMQTRSLCYVDDLLSGFEALMSGPSVPHPVNLGNPHELTILEIAELVIELVGRPATIRRLPLPQDDPTQRCPDIGVARSLLGWEPRVAVEDGLRRTVTYFAGQLAASQPRRDRIAEAAE
ncbi:UDP-glucuronic acid decarboxylase family protein [Lichenihabitans psoromatis]|uniref:UDP-glucuronic acid decarboxylase family protein n=1 Tax=Lichenihabitans psoromatis TaxID=2528642 RepID=UPI0010358ACC